MVAQRVGWERWRRAHHLSPRLPEKTFRKPKLSGQLGFRPVTTKGSGTRHCLQWPHYREDASFNGQIPDWLVQFEQHDARKSRGLWPIKVRGPGHKCFRLNRWLLRGLCFSELAHRPVHLPGSVFQLFARGLARLWFKIGCMFVCFVH